MSVRKAKQTNVVRKELILTLLAMGHINQIEAAALAGVSRQLVHQWCQKEGLFPHKQRAGYIEAMLLDAEGGYY
jgi:hypothetical protein